MRSATRGIKVSQKTPKKASTKSASKTTPNNSDHQPKSTTQAIIGEIAKQNQNARGGSTQLTGWIWGSPPRRIGRERMGKVLGLNDPNPCKRKMGAVPKKSNKYADKLGPHTCQLTETR